MDNFQPTLSKDQSVTETRGQHGPATTLHPVQDQQEYSDSQSVTGGMPLDTSLIEAGTVAICKKFELNPEKLENELRDVFQNLSPLIKLLAPGFQNIFPSLDNLLKLALQVKKALENNSINFVGKTFIFFYYYILANNKITFELQGNRNTIVNAEAFVIEPFEQKN